MLWKEQVAQLEKEGSFDVAIFLLKKVIKENPSNVEPYIFLLYRLMSSIVDNMYYWSNVSKDPLGVIKASYYQAKAAEEYRSLIQKYFDESYAQFSDNAEYLFYASGVLMGQYWFCCMQLDDTFLEAMQQKAFKMGYNTLLAQASTYRALAHQDPHNLAVTLYAHQIVNDLSLQEQLVAKGAAAQYVIGQDLNWAKRILEEASKQEKGA